MPSATVPCQYQTGKTLRSGPYALWKEAIHIKTRKFYACKVINKKDMQGREYLVQNEIAVLKRMQKGIPNVVKLHDYFETAHNVYLCSDLCTGGTLFDRIKANGAYSDGKAAGLIRDILIAVKHIHDSGIIHRDLRPETVFFYGPAETSTFVIADFGLSRMVEEAPHSHGELEIDGSSLCMAPEIILQAKHGKPVDIWAVGVLAFFVLAGCTPFDRETAKLQRDSIIAGEYKLTPDGKWDALSVNARDFISMCLLLDPDRRPTAKEALTHTWLIPPTPRFVRVESRPNSFLELHSAFRRVFNPKRKWRILGLTIKALNRMHTLAGHALPSTQPDMEESAQQTLADSSSTYFKGDDSESFQPQPPEDEIKDFPSPVSSVYTLDNRKSWLTKGSMSTAPTDEEEPAEASLHMPSQELLPDSSTYFKGDDSESFQPQPPEDEIKDFPSPVSSLYTLDDRKSWLTKGSMSTAPTDEEEPAEASLHMPSQESLLPDSSGSQENYAKQTGQGVLDPSSTSTPVYSPDAQEAISAEGNSTPGTADAPPISTFIIYTPHEISDNSVAVTPEDIRVVESCFPEGGSIVSTHRSTEAEAWIEAYYKDPQLEPLRSTPGLRGPVAAMLSSEVPALAIFGSMLDDAVLNMASTLAELSGFAVMVRPVEDDPVSRFAAPWTTDESPPAVASFVATSGGDVEEEHEDPYSLGSPSEWAGSVTEGPALRLRGGGGEEEDEEDNSVPWTSKAHKAAVWLKLWPDEKRDYSLSIRTKTMFLVQPEYPEENSTETQPEVIGRVKLTVETRAKVLPDRSYTSLGFLAHRQDSVIDREFIDCGFDYPDQTLKSITANSTQKTATVNAGYMNLHPTVAAGAGYSTTKSKTVELADSKPTPRCKIIHDPGERWNRDGKSYTSYDITTVPGQDPTTGMKHPLKAEYAMGITIIPNETGDGHPQISFITRNQVIIWIWDPTLKAKVRGLLVLMTTYIPNIRTRQGLVLQDDLDVHFATENPHIDTGARQPPATGKTTALSLSIAPIKTEKARKNGIIELFTDVRRKIIGPPKEPTLAHLPLQEYISRGWDATNEQWRSALWTSLDKDFRNTELDVASTSPVWKLGWNPRNPDEPESDDSDDREENPDSDHEQQRSATLVGDSFDDGKWKGKENDVGTTEIPQNAVAGPSTNV